MMKTFLLGLAMLLTVAVGCAAPAAETEEEGESNAAIKGPSTEAASCGPATPNKSCEAEFFLAKAAEMAAEDIVTNGIDVALDAKDCVTGLIALGAVSAATDGAAPALLISTGFIEALGTINACGNTVLYLNSIGIADNVSCFIEPSRNSPEVNTCECTQKCNGGIDEPDANGERYVTNTYKYGFIAPGAEICICTNDTKAVTCGWKCEKWASKSKSDCTCND